MVENTGYSSLVIRTQIALTFESNEEIAKATQCSCKKTYFIFIYLFENSKNVLNATHEFKFHNIIMYSTTEKDVRSKIC